MCGKIFLRGLVQADVKAIAKAIHLLLCVPSLNRNCECLLESICTLAMFLLRVLSLSVNAPLRPVYININ